MAVTPVTTSASTTAAQVSAVPRTANGGIDINSIVGGWVDRGPWNYYDTFYWPVQSPVAALPPEIDFFTVPIGQTDAYAPTPFRKTKLQTNMVRAGNFAPPRCLVLYNIGVALASTNTKADNDKFFNSCWMEFKIDDKIFYEGPPELYQSGTGMVGTQNQQGTDQNWTNGLPAPQFTMRAGSFPKYIAPLQQFSLAFFFPGSVVSGVYTPGTPPTLTAGFELKIFLNGLTDRSVQ